MVRRIFITGPVGSGKSTLARKIAKAHGMACCELDSLVYQPDPTSSTGNRKRSESERDLFLNEILSKSRWVVEDAGRAVFESAWRKADSIILLEPAVGVRKRRIVLRWVKQLLRVEKCGYTPGVYMLKLMFKWTRNYETGADGLKERLRPYWDKVTVIRTNKDRDEYLRRTFGVAQK